MKDQYRSLSPPVHADAALQEASRAKPVIRIAPYKIRKIGVVSTLLPGLAPKVVEKTLKVMADRIADTGASIFAERARAA